MGYGGFLLNGGIPIAGWFTKDDSFGQPRREWDFLGEDGIHGIYSGDSGMGMQPWDADQLPSLVFHIGKSPCDQNGKLDPEILHGGLGKVMGKSWNETGLNIGELNRSMKISVKRSIQSIHTHIYTSGGFNHMIHDYSAILFNHIIQPYS